MKILKYLVISLVVVSASFFAVGVFSPTVSYESSILVKKPIGYSFNVFTNPFYLDKWIPGFKDIKPISGMPNQVGSTYEMVIEENGEEMIMMQEMTGFEVNKLFAFKLTNDVLISNINVAFTEVNGKTKITATSVVKGNNILLRSLFPFMKSEFQKRDQETYDNLKKMIEGNKG